MDRLQVDDVVKIEAHGYKPEEHKRLGDCHAGHIFYLKPPDGMGTFVWNLYWRLRDTWMTVGELPESELDAIAKEEYRNGE